MLWKANLTKFMIQLSTKIQLFVSQRRTIWPNCLSKTTRQICLTDRQADEHVQCPRFWQVRKWLAKPWQKDPSRDSLYLVNNAMLVSPICQNVGFAWFWGTGLNPMEEIVWIPSVHNHSFLYPLHRVYGLVFKNQLKPSFWRNCDFKSSL